MPPQGISCPSRESLVEGPADHPERHLWPGRAAQMARECPLGAAHPRVPENIEPPPSLAFNLMPKFSEELSFNILFLN